MNQERLTFKKLNSDVYFTHRDNMATGYSANLNVFMGGEVIKKLGQLEDLMEKYGIKDLTELERVIVNNGTGEQAFKEFYEQNVKPYKDIEQELGIELSVLFKAITKGAYLIIDHHITFVEKIFLRTDIKPYCLDYNPVKYGFTNIKEFALKNYGKTWALTRKELEK